MPEEYLNIWKRADAVCLDVDSTVITGEGLDDLADFCGCGEEVAMWTSKAMGEGISFREALTARLNIFKPSKQMLEGFMRERPPTLTDNIKQLVLLLVSSGVAVYLVSGGLHSIVDHVAKQLDIPLERVFANRLLHNDKGSIANNELVEVSRAVNGAWAMIKECENNEAIASLLY